MEDGRLTDSAGRVVSFKNALVVLTSNIGSRAIASSGRSRLPLASPAGGVEAQAEAEDARAPAAVARTTVRALFAAAALLLQRAALSFVHAPLPPH